MRGLDPYDAAITGLGWATGLGFGAQVTWRELLAGRSALRAVESPDAPAGTGWAAPIERPWLRVPVPEDQESQAKFLNTSGELAATVLAEAGQQAGLFQGPVPPERRGLYIAQTDFSRAQCIDFRPAVLDATQQLTAPLDAQLLNTASLHKVNPFVLLETLNNNAFSFLCAVYGLRGANTSLSGFSGPGLAAASLAARAVRSRRVGAAVALGAGVCSPGVMRAELARMGLTPAGGAGEPVCRPLDARRAGLVPGDAAAALVLEPLEAARERGPGPYVVVVGHGSATGVPPTGAAGPDAETLAAALRGALREGGLRTSDLLGVVAPADGRRVEDRQVLEALADVLGDAPVPVTAPAGALGACAAGSDAGGVVLAALALREGTLPGTRGFEQAEPGFERLRLGNAPAAGPGRAVAVLSAGVDGQAHALVVGLVH